MTISPKIPFFKKYPVERIELEKFKEKLG